MSKGTIVLWSTGMRDIAVTAIMAAQKGSRVTIQDPRRSLDQNAKLHAMIRDMMQQRPRQNSSGETLDEEGWKQAVLRAMGRRLQFFASPFDDTVCAIYPRTSKMSVAECGEAIEFLYAAGAEWGVVWSEPDMWGHKPSNGEK